MCADGRKKRGSCSGEVQMDDVCRQTLEAWEVQKESEENGCKETGGGADGSIISAFFATGCGTLPSIKERDVRKCNVL